MGYREAFLTCDVNGVFGPNSTGEEDENER